MILLMFCLSLNLNSCPRKLRKNFIPHTCPNPVHFVMTGVTENDDVLKRFLSQKETKDILDTMKTMSENEKRLLIQKNEEMKTRMKSYYFSEVNDVEG